MSGDKINIQAYTVFSHQMETIVYISTKNL